MIFALMDYVTFKPCSCQASRAGLTPIFYLRLYTARQMVATSIPSESSPGSTSVSSLSSGSPHSSPSPDTTYTKYAEKLDDVLQPQEQSQGAVGTWEGVEEVSTVENSPGEGVSARLEEADVDTPNDEAEAVPTTSSGLEMFTSRINLVSDWAMSRLSLTSSSSFSSASSVSSITPSESESSTGTVRNLPVVKAQPDVVEESAYDNQDTLTSASSSSTSTIQTRIPWRDKGKEKATDDVASSNVAQLADGAPPSGQKPVKHRRRISRTIPKRRIIPIYHEPGFCASSSGKLHFPLTNLILAFRI